MNLNVYVQVQNLLDAKNVLDGRKSLCNEVTIITNLSNHIPIFTKIDKIKVAIIFVLIL